MNYIAKTMALLAFAVYSVTIYASELIQFVVDSENPPFMYEKNGKAEGLYPRLLSLLFKDTPYQIEITPMPWKRAIHLLDKNKAAIAGIYKNKQRFEKYDYTEKIFVEKILIYVGKKSQVKFNTLDDLRKLKIGVIRGWSYSAEFDDAVKKQVFAIEESTSDELNFKKLAADRIDAVVAVQESAQLVIQREKLVGKFRELENPLTVNPTHIAFNKSAKKNELIEAINHQIKKNDILKLAETILQQLSQQPE